MRTWLRVLACYAIALALFGTVSVVAYAGQPIPWDPVAGVLAVLLQVPLAALGILVLTRAGRLT